MTGPRPRLTRIEGGRGSGPSRAASLELTALGTGLVACCVLMARIPSWRNDLVTFQTLYAVAFGFFALAMLGSERLSRARRPVFVVLLVALAARIALLLATPTLSDDVYRYLWEGKVAAHGANPYRTSPEDPSLAALRDRAIHPRINHPHLASVYPPLALAGFAAVAAISPTVTAMKLWIVAHDLAILGVLAMWLRSAGLPAVALAAYAWNPLVLVEYAGSGHHDPTGLLWLVVALMWAERRPVLSAVALAASILVKLAPLLLLPVLWPRWPWRARIAALGLTALGGGWFWWQTRGAASGLDAYWTHWRNNELAFVYLERLAGSPVAARALAGALVLATMVWVLRRGWTAALGARAVLRTATLVSPVVHPWYLGWPLVLEPLRPSAPWLTLSLLAILSYGVLATPPEGGRFHLSLEGRWLEYGVPALIAALLALRKARQRRMLVR